MAGHSKWANIRHRKGAQDAARAKVFAKFSKEIMVAAALGGPDLSTNSSLRLAVAKAKSKSMPKKNIENAIAKATGAGSGKTYKDVVYAGNVAGVSFLINCLTDNVNRIAASIQSYFNKVNGSVSGPSSVAYIFDRKGVLEFDVNGRDEDEMMMLSLDAGATDFEKAGDSYFVYTEPSTFSSVKDELEKQGITEFKTAEVLYEPNQETKLPKEKATKILAFIDRLEDDEDIQDVYHNLDASSLE